MGAGTQTAGLGFGGYTGQQIQSATEEYDGSTWTAGGNIGTARRALGSVVFKLLLCVLLDFHGGTTATEEYDGSALDCRWKYRNS
jgi:hypothetical protein